MKYTEAIESIRKDNDKYFEAWHDGDRLQLWGDRDGFYVYIVAGLLNIGNPWFVFDLDWQEKK